MKTAKLTKTITKSQYLQATGLLHLAHKHMELVNQFQNALEDLLEPDVDHGLGYCGDAVWGPGDIDSLLSKIDTSVEKK